MGEIFFPTKEARSKGQKEKAQITHSNLRRHCNQKRNDEIVQKTPKQKWVIKNKIEPDARRRELQTPDAESQTPDAESQTPDAESQTPDAESQTPDA